MTPITSQPREAHEDHQEVLSAISKVNILSELLEQKNNRYVYELDLEVIVYGRTYAGRRVGPYARLFTYASGEKVIHEGDWAGNSFYILVEGELNYMKKGGQGEDRPIKLGDVFGEMSVIEGDQRSATVAVPDGRSAKVLEIKRPALRLVRKLPKFERSFNVDYHQHGLEVTLRTVQIACNDAFSKEMLEQLGEFAQFKVYGRPHVLLQEGKPITHVFFINKGWVKVGRNVSGDSLAGETTNAPDEDSGMRFLGAGNCFGLEVFNNGDAKWQYTVSIQARTELLEIPVESLHAHPQLQEILKENFSNFSQVDEGELLTPIPEKVVAAVQEEVMSGIVDGTNLLVMDMDLCIRCGNCSLACHKVHGQSRLLRRGLLIDRPRKPNSKSVQHVLAPSVCLHCQDPECLTGCPTGAIGRLPGSQIDIDKKTCIGCGDCATQCPYNAISMVPAKEQPPPTWLHKIKGVLKFTPQKLPSLTGGDDHLVAIKCNLCEGTSLNPPGKLTKAYSCQENCPTGALVRVNPREYFSETKNVIGTIYYDQTHAIGRNIHKGDPTARHWHIGGMLAVAIFALAAWWVTGRYGLDESLGGTVANVRWITGIIGLLGIIGEMLYLARKQIYKKRCGALRYWMLAHVYLGVITCMVLLIHGGWHSRGLLTSTLMISFDLTIISGVVGIASYYIAPRMLTKIEGNPLLLDDLLVRRQELRQTLLSINTEDEKLEKVINESIQKRLLSLRYLLKQYLHPVELTTSVKEAHKEFAVEVDRLELSASSRSLLDEAVEAVVTLRRVDALIYLHQLLKLWIAPHVVSTSIMLVLMAVHIFQVIYFR
jgi:Fe-S-cluster-containing dehydrogenase component/CRP-like cAMP-binding protein